MYKRIVVPLDGSEIAETALVEAEKMALLTGAPVHLVRVVDFTNKDMAASYGMMTDASAVSVLLGDEVDAARQYLEFVAARIADQGFAVTSEVQRGTVFDRLIAVTRQGDLIVMASHGRSGIARWFLGSVAEEVIRRSTVPVLLVRASTHPNDGGNRIAARYPERIRVGSAAF